MKVRYVQFVTPLNNFGGTVQSLDVTAQSISTRPPTMTFNDGILVIERVVNGKPTSRHVPLTNIAQMEPLVEVKEEPKKK